MPSPAKFRNARGKGWRFFEWGSRKILPEPCVEKSHLRVKSRPKGKTSKPSKKNLKKIGKIIE